MEIPKMKKKLQSTQQSHQVRIIGGTLKRSILRFPESEDVRPTTDRVRETLFNWLAPHIQGVSCLDLFAGSGVLGLEALSRGARACTMIERDAVVCQAIKQNTARLFHDQNHAHATIIQQDALRWLDQPQDLSRYCVVFLDPPYQSNLLAQTLKLIKQHHIPLYQKALFYLEHHQPLEQCLTQGLNPIKTAHYAQVYFGLYRASDG